eukprot:UN19538
MKFEACLKIASYHLIVDIQVDSKHFDQRYSLERPPLLEDPP